MGSLKNNELIEFIKGHIVGTVVTILAFFAVAGAGVIFFEEQIVSSAQWIDSRFGFWGLSVILFVGDSFMSPIPPDVLMVIISKGPMKAQWPSYVFGFGVISSIAGLNGYFIGYMLSTRKWAKDFMENFQQKNAAIVRKYGFWAVAIGALTPFPFSVTCWSAGFLRLPMKSFIPASLLRIPRFFLYYLAIDYGLRISEFF